MDKKVFEILSALRPFGINAPMSITRLILDYYPAIDKMNEQSVIGTYVHINRLLEAMKAAGQIEILNLPYPKKLENGSYLWYDTIPITVSITQQGLRDLEDVKRRLDESDLNESMIQANKSVESTNTATQKNYKFQKLSAIVSLILASVSTLFIIVTARQQILDKTPERLRDITNALQETKKELQGMRASVEKTNANSKEGKNDSIALKTH